jgi:hypothetical protein
MLKKRINRINVCIVLVDLHKKRIWTNISQQFITFADTSQKCLLSVILSKLLMKNHDQQKQKHDENITKHIRLLTPMILTNKNTNTCQIPISKNTTYTMTLTRDSLIYPSVHCMKIPVIIVEYVFQKKLQFVKAQTRKKIDKLSLQLTFFYHFIV